jgi:predicted lactoylglutathione lyase
MDRRVSLITLGVADLGASRAFYERLGLAASPASNADVAFFQLDGMALALFGRAALAEDAHVANSQPGFSGITIAQNQHSKAEVDRIMAEAKAAGATILKPAQDVFWGGYCGYFSDPDGHLWEIAWNPFFPLDARGRLSLPT